MKSKEEIESLLEQLPVHVGHWDSYKAALKWVLSDDRKSNPLGAWGTYVAPADSQPLAVREVITDV
jgi:hypothetical protein